MQEHRASVWFRQSFNDGLWRQSKRWQHRSMFQSGCIGPHVLIEDFASVPSGVKVRPEAIAQCWWDVVVAHEHLLVRGLIVSAHRSHNIDMQKHQSHL